MSDNLIVVKTFQEEQNARAAKHRLETAGIRAYLPDVMPTAQPGEVKLRVAEQDAEKATELLTTRPEELEEPETAESFEEGLARVKEKVDRLDRKTRIREKLVLIKTFSSVEMAYIARNRLESEGIRAFLTDDLSVGLFGFVTGGAKLHVTERDVKRAVALLESISGASADGVKEEDKSPAETSSDFARGSVEWWLVVIMGFIGLGVLVILVAMMNELF